MEKRITLSVVLASFNALENISMTDLVGIVSVYLNSKDCGKMGNTFETIVRAILCAEVEHRHPSNMADMVRRYQSIETKQGAGMLASGLTRKEAEQMVETGNVNIAHSRYIIYCPKFTSPRDLLENTYVLPKARFIALLAKYGLLRVKKQSCGSYAVAIQNYLPTQNFTGLRVRFDFLEELATFPSLQEFANK